MSTVAILIDRSGSLLDRYAQIPAFLDNHDIELVRCNEVESALEILRSPRLPGDPLLIIVDSAVKQPVRAARWLVSAAPMAHILILAGAGDSGLAEQLASPLAGIGGYWSLLEADDRQLAGKLERIIHTATQRYHQGSTLQQRKHHLDGAPGSRHAVLRSYTNSVRFLSNMLDSAHDAIIATTDEGIIIRWNLAASRMFNIPNEEALGRQIADINGEPWRRDITNLLAGIRGRKDETASGELGYLGGDRLVRHADVRLSWIVDEQECPIGVAIMARDITARKKAEDEVAALHRQLELYSYYDALTGVGNRRLFDLSLEKEWYRALRQGKPLALAMFDIDFFKQYNDRLGHQRGDQCLKTVASRLNDSKRRSSDLITRYGGEEFALLLPETSLDEALAIAERYRESIEQLGIEHLTPGSGGVVTVSVGVAEMTPASGIESASLIATADAQLYLAKRGGRNRVCGSVNRTEFQSANP